MFFKSNISSFSMRNGLKLIINLIHTSHNQINTSLKVALLGVCKVPFSDLMKQIDDDPHPCR